MDQQTRLEATKAIWTAIALVLITMVVAAGVWGDGLQGPHIALGVFLAMAGMGSMSFVWDTGKDSDAQKDQEKAKRERIDKVIRDLSDDELLSLKQRLSDGSIDDNLLYDQMTLSDDGELIRIERRS